MVAHVGCYYAEFEHERCVLRKMVEAEPSRLGNTRAIWSGSVIGSGNRRSGRGTGTKMSSIYRARTL
jgi:hypothetical protein